MLTITRLILKTDMKIEPGNSIDIMEVLSKAKDEGGLTGEEYSLIVEECRRVIDK